jgi:tetratricopeptide (TPR) repeat protein
MLRKLGCDLLIVLCCALSVPTILGQPSETDDPIAAALASSRPEAVQQAWNAKRRFFILTTVDKYTTPNADLPFAAVDGQKVSEFLKKAGYEDLGTFADTTATRDNFVEALKKVRSLPENSRVVVYYSGHGVLDAEGKNLWLQMYGQPVLSDHHGIAVSELVDTARGGSYNGELTILLDSCFSGEGVLTAGLTLKDLGPGTTIFTSSSDIQESQKIDLGNTQMSAFTYSLLRALTDDWDQVDPGKSGFIGYKELHLYSIKQLRAWNRQGKVTGLMRPLLLSNDDMIFTYDPLRDRQGPSLYRDTLLGEALYAALAPTDKLTTVISFKMVALRYPIPPARARQIASYISGGQNSFVAALQAIAQGRAADADMYLNKASKSRALRARVARVRAWNALYAGKFSEAATQYKTALALARGDSRRALLLETANALQLAGNAQDASVLYAQVVQMGNASSDPLTAVALNNWGTAHIALGNIEAAEQAFDKSLAISGRSGSVNLDVATTSANMAYVAQHKGDDARATVLQEKSEDIRSGREFKGHDYSPWSDVVSGAASGAASIVSPLLKPDKFDKPDKADKPAAKPSGEKPN